MSKTKEEVSKKHTYLVVWGKDSKKLQTIKENQSPTTTTCTSIKTEVEDISEKQADSPRLNKTVVLLAEYNKRRNKSQVKLCYATTPSGRKKILKDKVNHKINKKCGTSSHWNNEEGMRSSDEDPLQAALKGRIQCPEELNSSLTSMNWLGQMSGHKLVENANKDQRVTASSKILLEQEKESEQEKHERPPFSYLHLIQMAINSKPDKRMTLREIYSWIETKFPYYKYNAKHGWKNSIRHNLSLYNIFVRENYTTASKKLGSYWTILANSTNPISKKHAYYERVRERSQPVLPNVPTGYMFVPVYPTLSTSPTGSSKVVWTPDTKQPITANVLTPPETRISPLSNIIGKRLSREVNDTEPVRKQIKLAPKITNDAPFFTPTVWNNIRNDISLSDSTSSLSSSADSGIDVRSNMDTAPPIPTFRDQSKNDLLSRDLSKVMSHSKDILHCASPRNISNNSWTEAEVNDMLQTLGAGLMSPPRLTDKIRDMTTSTPTKDQNRWPSPLVSRISSDSFLDSSVFSPRNFTSQYHVSPKSHGQGSIAIESLNTPKLFNNHKTSSPIKIGSLRDFGLLGLTPLKGHSDHDSMLNQSWSLLLNDVQLDSITEEPLNLSIPQYS